MYGLQFGDKHSYKDFGLVMKSKDRPILPDPKVITEDLDQMDGSHDFSDTNQDERTKYKDRIITVTFSLTEKDSSVLRVKAHQIARWLNCGESRLTFDDETAVYYIARVNNKISFEKQIISLQEFTVQFKAKPYAYSVVDSTVDQLQLGMDLQLGYGYKLDMYATEYDVVGSDIITIYNAGDYVKPKIEITGTFTNLTLACNNKALTYNSALTANHTLIIDLDKYNATLDSANVNNNLSGSFFELVNGDNLLTITGTSVNIHMKLIFNYMYL